MTERSNLDQEVLFDNWTTLFKFVLFEWSKANLHTAMPGLVEVYDAERRRARVRPALRLIRANGEPMERTPLVNVPVVFPAGGGFSFTFPLAAGDPVVLLFSERGIAAFKDSYELTNPTPGSFFSLSDAVALPGFGPLTLTPASTTGATWQNHAGDTAIVVEPDNIHINVRDGQSVHIGGPGGEELATRTFVETYYNTHTHPTLGSVPATPAPLTPGTDLTEKAKSE